MLRKPYLLRKLNYELPLHACLSGRLIWTEERNCDNYQLKTWVLLEWTFNFGALLYII